MKKYRNWMLSLLVLAVVGALAAGWAMTVTALQSEAAALEQSRKAAQDNADHLAAELAARALLPEGMGEPVPLGDYLVTAYCVEEYPHICGGNGVTATGTKPTPGITAAADWGQLPPGSVIYIVGVGIRVIEDSGSAVTGNVLDVAVATHTEALSWPGYGHHEVWLLQWGGENQ